MKALLLATLLLSSTATANESNAAEEKLIMCTNVAEFAGKVAEAQQEGIALHELLNLEAVKPMTNIVIAVYTDNTRYQTESMQQRVISETKTNAMLACMGSE